ncbi:MAG: hypothetical protein HOP12_08180 [Candidatus Eisenbacteria bacterium]|uniref:Uncharacterized protein n=1 Tax=Eiseniibacteriota bacterium TaxID=2212470 RepID=A0A849SRX2_UNCEI|nr:hypothetical protein [Candidatus Eisenbacteria bacterium]
MLRAAQCVYCGQRLEPKIAPVSAGNIFAPPDSAIPADILMALEPGSRPSGSKKLWVLRIGTALAVLSLLMIVVALFGAKK